MKVLQIHEIRIKHLLDLMPNQIPKIEVPVASAIYDESDQLLSLTFNQMETSKDATKHAEILAIQEAAQKVQKPNLKGKTIYVTLEPCLMCMGAIINSNINRVVFGAFDKNRNFYQLFIDLYREKFPHIEIIGGVLENKCQEILSDWFKSIR